MGRAWARLIKALALLACVGAAAVGIAAVALKHYLPPEKLRSLVVEQAEKTLRRQVRLKGISLGVIRGLTLTGLEVSEAPDFRSGVFAAVDKFQVGLRWLPLLSKRIEIERVSLEGPRFRILRGKDGTFNFSDLAGPDSKPAPPSGAAAGAPAASGLSVDRAKISRGSVEFRDAASGDNWALSDVELALHGFSLNGPFDLSLSLAAKGSSQGKNRRGSIDLAGKLDLAGLDLSKAAAKLKRLSLKTEGYVLKLAGEVTGFEDVKADLEASLADGEGELGTARIKGSVARRGAPPYDAVLEVQGKARPLRASRLNLPGLPKGFHCPEFTAQSKLGLSGEDLRLDSLRVEAQGAGLEASGSVLRALGSKPVPDLAFSVRADLPALHAADLDFLPGIPKGAAMPKSAVRAKGRLSGQDLSLESFQLNTDRARVEASGKIAGALSGSPAPDLKATAAMDLPALTSEDLAWVPGIPPGLRLPPLKLDASVFGGLDALRISSFGVRAGGSEFELSGKLTALRSEEPGADLLIKGKSFVLDELAKISPQTRDLGLTGRGFFALSATGREKRPYLAGKIRFDGLGANVGGMKLSGYSGTVTCDDKRIAIPNLRGKFGAGDLSLDVTIKDYVRAPQVEIDGSLSSVDLAALFAARPAQAPGSPGAVPGGAAAGKDPKSPPVSTRGKFSIGQWAYSGMTAKDTKVVWDLSGITPELTGLSGSAKLDVGQGRLENLGEMAAQSKIVKVLAYPLIVIQKIGRIGGVQVFPDLNNIAFDSIVGDYAFARGVMTLRECRLGGADARVSSTGKIELAAGRLDLLVTAQVGRVQPVDVEVKGTFDKPSTSVKVLKFLTDPAKRALEEGGRKLLQGLFK